MAFTKRIENLLKRSVSSNPSVFQAIRCMSSSKVFVGGMAYATDEHSLGETFSKYGEVVEARVIMDRETGRSKGFGFVTFNSSEEASAAITGMDGKDLYGRIVKVNYATDRPRFGGSGSYGGGSGYGGGGFGGSGYGGGGGGYGGGYGGGGYGGGGGGYGGDSYGSGGGGGYNVAGGAGGSDNYTSGGYDGGGGGYGSGGGYNVAGGSGGSDNYNSGGAGDNYVSGGSHGQSGDLGYGNTDNVYAGRPTGGSGGFDSFKDDDGEPDDFANRRS